MWINWVNWLDWSKGSVGLRDKKGGSGTIDQKGERAKMGYISQKDLICHLIVNIVKTGFIRLKC